MRRSRGGAGGSVPEPLLRALMIAAAEAHEVITHPPEGVRNMSEWAKKQACWNGLKTRKLDLDVDFESCLVPVEAARTVRREARSARILTEGINAQTEVVKLGAGFWKSVLDWGCMNGKLSPKDARVLQVCASIPRRLPADFQSKHALDLLGRLREHGFDGS